MGGVITKKRDREWNVWCACMVVCLNKIMNVAGKARKSCEATPLVAGHHGQSLSASSSKRSKRGVPSPDTGSHPSTAWNPLQLPDGLSPSTMSVNAPPSSAAAYRKGFIHPIVALPFAFRASLRSDTRWSPRCCPGRRPRRPRSARRPWTGQETRGRSR